MRRTGIQSILFAFLALLLVFFLTPSAAYAAGGLANDNHTDTDDYCMRAHDVTVLLSEFSSKTRSQLESDIVSASAFVFRIRDPLDASNFTGLLTSGYTVDFSGLSASPSASGYLVTVTLPAIYLPDPSQISFRVFVTDDTPVSYPVGYAFTSGTPGHALPSGVLALCPANASAVSGTGITPSASFSSVRDGAGEWTFSGWSPATQSVSNPGISFSGVWLWTALPVHTVSFRFESTSSNRALPQEALTQLPSAFAAAEGDVVTAPGGFAIVHTGGGFWRFAGWDTHTQTVADSDIVFTGIWRWRAYAAESAAAEPTVTPIVSPTPSPTATMPPASPAPTAFHVQVLNQDTENPPPLSGGTDDSSQGAGAFAAKAAASAVLSALVASQAFAVASDLKVLQWYRAKKAARRVRG